MTPPILPTNENAAAILGETQETVKAWLVTGLLGGLLQPTLLGLGGWAS